MVELGGQKERANLGSENDDRDFMETNWQQGGTPMITFYSFANLHPLPVLLALAPVDQKKHSSLHTGL